MPTLADTHSTYKELLEAGVPEQQADVTARLFGRWTEERLVTREYLDMRLEALEQRISVVEQRLDAKIDGVEQRLEAKLGGLEQRFDAKLAELEKRVTNRMLTMTGVIVGVLGTLMTVLNFFG